MKVGSLVTPRWNKEEMMDKLRATNPIAFLRSKLTIPEFGQIYTISDIKFGVRNKGQLNCVLAEIDVAIYNGAKVYIPAIFYVEVDPPQENVQAIVDEIVNEPVLVDTLDYAIKKCREMCP